MLASLIVLISVVTLALMTNDPRTTLSESTQSAWQQASDTALERSNISTDSTIDPSVKR